MKLLYTREQIAEQIRRVASEINRDYADKDLLLVGVLKGSVVFLTQLLLELQGNVQIDFMTVSSYKHGTESGELKLVQDLDTAVHDRDVLIVEDILDTGKTAKFIHDYLRQQGARSIEMAVLVNKDHHRKFRVPEAKYIAFQYDQKPFIVGHGFDCGEQYRNLPDIYMLEEGDLSQPSSS